MAQESGWTGWIYFAGAYMMLVGFFQMIFGFVALFNQNVLAVTSSNVWILDLSTWGWVHMLFGILMFFAGIALFSGKMWGQVVAVILAGLSAIANFAFIPAYPIWSIIIIAVDMFVIYAILTHGSELKLNA